MAVLNHKTDYDGPAYVNIDEELYTYLGIFIKFIRNDVKPTTNKVFLSWNGGHMDTSMMGTQLKSFWTKAVGNVGKRMNSTLLRKLATTTVHRHLPQHKRRQNSLPGKTHYLANLITWHRPHYLANLITWQTSLPSKTHYLAIR